MTSFSQVKIKLSGRPQTIVFMCFLWLTSPAVYSSEALVELYQEVVSETSEEAVLDQARESRFRASAEAQAQLLKNIEADISSQERKKINLKSQFDKNEEKLSNLSTTLDRRIGDLGELFGVYRQTTDDTQSLLFDSLITLEYPERRKEIENLSSTSEVPTIPEIQELWRLLMHEITNSGRISRFEAEVVAPEGSSYLTDVMRVGTFNIVTDDKYLSYLAEENKAAELPRQPAGYARDTARELSSKAGGETVTFSLDPSRGALLSLLVQSPSILERVQQGKTVGYLIIFLGVVGLVLVIERWMRLNILSRRMNHQLKNMDQISDDNPIGRIMGSYYESEHLQDLEVISRKLETIVITDVAAVKRGIPLIKVFAAVAPLMGLLGTVSGMIETFQAITLFGTGDPKLMAGGISTALITTVLGLCVAIPLLLSHSFLNGRSLQMSKIIGEQAAGMMAQKAESIAEEKNRS